MNLIESSLAEGPQARGIRTGHLVHEVQANIPRRFTLRNASAMLRWLSVRARFRSIEAGLFFLDAGSVVDVGPGVRVVVGKGVVFMRDVTARFYGTASIGDRTFVNRGVYLSCQTGLEIGADCLIGEYVCIHDEDHCFGPGYQGTRLSERPFISSPIRIGDNVWIGAKATITRGVSIGEDSVVASNSVVTRDVPPHSLVAGAPAKVIRSWGPALRGVDL